MAGFKDHFSSQSPDYAAFRPGYPAELFAFLAGLLALWCYGRRAIEPALDAVVEDFHGGLLGPNWPPERRHVEAGYRDLPFPFGEPPAPTLAMAATWTLDQLLGYFSTWSALKAYRKVTGHEPLPAMRQRLAAAWISLDTGKTIKWPLSVRLGRI